MDHYTKLQSRPLHPRMHSPSPSRPEPHRRWWLAAASLLTLPFLLYLFLAARRIHFFSPYALPPSPKAYTVIIAAGRGGSRAHIFEFLNEGRTPFVGDGAGAVSPKARPGIGAFAGRPDGTGRYVRGLLEFARRAVPQGEWGRTEVRLMESGGLQGVEEEAGKRVMEECRKAMRSSGFVFKDEWARSITGKERGVYAWVAVNYVLGVFGKNSLETMGVVDFEGATAQITFSSSRKPPRAFSYTLNLPRMTYNLYARSIHQLEQEAAWDFLEKIHNDKSIPPFYSSPRSIKGTTMNACIPKGYSQTHNLQIPSSSTELKSLVHSWGNFSECRFQLLKLLQEEKDICSQKPCKMLSRLLSKSWGKNDIAENFIYTSELLGLFPRASLSDLEASGKHYCEDDWVELQKEHFHVDETDLLKYCFLSSYLLAFLHDHLGIPMEKRSVGLTNQTRSAPLDWTLGAFILQRMAEPEQEPDNLNHNVEDDSLTYIVLFTIFLLLSLVIFFVWRWQKPQPKMIYDLGQGHYIVTRHS